MSFSDHPRVVSAATLPSTELVDFPLDPQQMPSGPVSVRVLDVAASAGVEIGIWEHSPGTSTDVEVDEAFVVLSGSASIHFADGPTLDIGVGDVVLLPAGSRTTWTIHQTLRKVYVAAEGWV